MSKTSQEEDRMDESMPWATEAEDGALGWFVNGGSEFMAEQRATFMPEWFYHPGNRLFFVSLVEMYDASLPIDLQTVVQYLMDKEILDKVGGAARPAEVQYISMHGMRSHFEEYRRMMQDRYLLRMLIANAQEVRQLAMQCTAVDDPGQVASLAEAKMFEVVTAAQNRGQYAKGAITSGQAAMLWAEHMQMAFDSRGRITGITTGLVDIDRTLHGLDDKEGEILTTAGRPGMGKTALASTFIAHQIEVGVPGAVFGLEMSNNQLLTRVVLGGMQIDTAKATTGLFSREEMQQLGKKALELNKAKVFWNDSAALTTADLRSEVQVLKRKHGIRWIVVDHLHLVKAVGEAAQRDERLKLVEVMETLQFIKKQFKVVVLLLVQMSRESDRNAGKLPVLADLQGSAAIEQFSDHVIFIHRPPYYKPWKKLNVDQQEVWINGHRDLRNKSPDCWSDGSKYKQSGEDFPYARQDYEEQAMLCVRKNRRGPTPELEVRYQPEYTRFSSRTPKLYSNNKLERQQPKQDEDEDPFV